MEKLSPHNEDPNISFMVVQSVMESRWVESANSQDHAQYWGAMMDQVFANVNKLQVENDDDLIMFWLDNSQAKTCTAVCKLTQHTVEGIPEILEYAHIHFIWRVGYAEKRFLDRLNYETEDDEAASPG
jgi:hypothetical protein